MVKLIDMTGILEEEISFEDSAEMFNYLLTVLKEMDFMRIEVESIKREHEVVDILGILEGERLIYVIYDEFECEYYLLEVEI